MEVGAQAFEDVSHPSPNLTGTSKSGFHLLKSYSMLPMWVISLPLPQLIVYKLLLSVLLSLGVWVITWRVSAVGRLRHALLSG